MVLEGVCNTGLSLGSTSINNPENDHFHQSHHHHQHKINKLSSLKLDHVFPSLTLGLSSEHKHRAPEEIVVSKIHGEIESTVFYRQGSSRSAVSSYSNSSVKRERDNLSAEEVERVSSKVSDDQDQDEEGSARKKLRLTKEQSIILEDKAKAVLGETAKSSATASGSLVSKQESQESETKLKQTEVECEELKKCYKTLTDENRRLQKELQELKVVKITAPVYMQMPAATLTMCPSCERIGDGSGENSSKSPFSIGAKPHFYNPFTHPSAAC
ncbi:unnamed protein product [Camellia sinensis]